MTDREHHSRAGVMAAYLAIYLIWGSTYVFVKIVVVDIPPLLTGALRNIAAGAFLYTWARARGVARPSGREWQVAALIGTLLLACGNASVNVAIKHVPSGLTALLVTSVPVWMVMIDWLRPRGAAPHGRVIAGLILGGLGIGALVWSAGGIGARTSNTSATLAACGGLLLGSLAWAAGSILSRHLPKHSDWRLATGMEMAIAGVVLSIASTFAGELSSVEFANIRAVTWWSLAYLVVLGSIITFSAYKWLLQVSTPAKVATYAYVNPLVAVTIGTAFAGEPLTRETVVGAALLLGAVVLITLPRRSALP